jgi:hypothetical protein
LNENERERERERERVSRDVVSNEQVVRVDCGFLYGFPDGGNSRVVMVASDGK